MSCTRAFLHGFRRLCLCIFLLAGLSAATFAQTDYYVDSATGNNFNAGTLASPWQTVNFALKGIHVPLPTGSTIHLLSSSAPYDANSGDVFPWVLDRDISLVATPGGSGTDYIVSGNGAASLIELFPTDSFSACTIRGLTLQDGGTGITVAPSSGVSQGLTIENCTFKNSLFYGIAMTGTAGSWLSPVIRNNSIESGWGVSYSISGCAADGRFESNDFKGSGFYITGTPSAGSTLVSYNQMSLGSWLAPQGFNGLAEISHNIMTDSGLQISSCPAWNPQSRVELNSFTAGSGISISSSADVMVSDNTLSGCGIYTSDNSTLRNNTITGCASGWVVVAGGAAAQVIDNVISSNSSGTPAVYVNAPNVVVEGNKIQGNGGVAIQDVSCVGSRYVRNLITGNGSHGLWLNATSTTTPPVILNNTIADNAGNGIRSDLQNVVGSYVTNCILWNNNLAGCDIFGLSATQFSYCDIQQCGSPGNGNISANPLFVNSASGDYHLQPGSPCINTGDPASAMDCDGSRADMGALPTGACGASFCSGDGTGTACPCGNSGLAGNGCASSINANGASLISSGSASIVADTLVLTGSGMPNSSALYFQGTAQAAGGAGAVFGDGLRCVAGSVVRLGTKSNAAGASSYPTGANPSISIKGLVAAPGTRFYQVWYRNAAAFCQPETFNLTNGLRVDWTL